MSFNNHTGSFATKWFVVRIDKDRLSNKLLKELTDESSINGKNERLRKIAQSILYRYGYNIQLHKVTDWLVVIDERYIRIEYKVKVKRKSREAQS